VGRAVRGNQSGEGATPFSGFMDYEIEKIRKAFSEFLKNINWMNRTSRLSYDWAVYGHPGIVRLCNLLNVDLGTGELKKQDKKGHWRVMK
jgi:hypothetical protein